MTQKTKIIIYESENEEVYRVECSDPENTEVMVIEEFNDGVDPMELRRVSFYDDLIQVSTVVPDQLKESEFSELENTIPR